MLPSNCSAGCGSCARQLYDGANDDLLQEDFCHNCVSRVCLSQSPCPHIRPLLTCASKGDAQTLKGRSGSVSVGLLVLGAHKVLFEPSEHLWQVWGLILNVIFAPPILLGLLLCPWTWCIFFLVGSNILLLMGVQQRVAILEFSQEEMSERPASLPSCFIFLGSKPLQIVTGAMKLKDTCSLEEKLWLT